MNRDTVLTFVTDLVHFGFPNGLQVFRSRSRKNGETKLRLKQLPHPVFIRCGTSDMNTFDQVFKSKEFNLGSLIGNNANIIDGGANIGLVSVFLSRQFPDARIIAVEPEKSNFEQLIKNTRPYKNIHCLHGALWNQNSTLQVTDQNRGNWGYVVSDTTPSGNEIPAFSIVQIMERFDLSQVDLLKLDIEGSELELFSGGYQSWLPKVKVISIELHDTLRKGTSRSFFSAILTSDYNINVRGEKIIAVRN